MNVYRIVDKNGRFVKTYRHMGHVRQALNYLRLSWRWSPLYFDVVEYELTEISRIPAEEA